MAHIHVGKKIASTAASAWTRQISTLLLYAVAGRMLTPDQIGLVALSAALVLLFEYGIFDSVSEAIVQRAALDRSHVGSALALAGVLAVSFAGLGHLVSDWVAGLFALPDLAPLLRAMSLGVGIICLSAVHAGILRREARFDMIALLAAFAAIVAVALGIVLLIADFGLSAMIAYFLIEKVILCVGTIWLARAEPLGRISASHLRDLAPYAAAISGQRMAFHARSQMDRVLIGVLWGAGILGAYQIAARIFDSLLTALLAPTTKLFFVSYTKLQHHPEQLRDMFTRSLQAVALISFPAFLGVSAVAPEAISVLFGDQWGSSAIILEVLGFGGLALTLSLMSGAVLSAVGRARDFLFVEVTSTLAGLVLLMILSRAGIAWMAAAFVVREGIAVAIYARLLGNVLGLSPRSYIGCFAPCLVAACAMWLVVASLDFGPLAGASELVRLLAKVAVGTAAYGLLMLAFGRVMLAQTINFVITRPNAQDGGA